MPQPPLVPVESSAVEAVGYAAAERELYVRFVGGDLYAYADVSEDEYRALLNAESKGTFVNREIKPHHGYRRV